EFKSGSGMLGGKPLRRAGENGLGGRFTGRNREPGLLHVIAAVLGVLSQRRELLYKRPGELIQKFTIEGNFDLRSSSFKQDCTQVTFERLHLQRYCGLGEIQPARRLRDASGLNDCAKSS